MSIHLKKGDSHLICKTQKEADVYLSLHGYAVDPTLGQKEPVTVIDEGLTDEPKPVTKKTTKKTTKRG